MSNNEESEGKKQHKKKIFLRQIKTILESFIADTPVTIEFSTFESEFHRRTRLIFGDHLYNFQIAYRDEEWSLTPLFSRVRLLRHNVEVKYVNGMATLDLYPSSPQPPSRSVDIQRTPEPPSIEDVSNTQSLQENHQSSSDVILDIPSLEEDVQIDSRAVTTSLELISIAPSTEEEVVENIPEIPEIPTESNQNEREEAEIRRSPERSHNGGFRMDTPQEDVVSTSASSQQQDVVDNQILWKDVDKMFENPYWPGVSPQFRQENFLKYQNLLEFAKGKHPKDMELLISSKRLAINWWKNSLRFFPQLLYLLRRLADATPFGFKLSNLEKEIKEVYPEKWLEFWPITSGILSAFYTNPDDLVSLNVIMRCDPNDRNMFKVNKVIKLMGFHEIRDHQLSMIYQFVNSSPGAKSTQNIHSFMCDDFPGWKERYNGRTGCDQIWEICTQSPKMFITQCNMVSSRDHRTKLPVPICFSFFVF